MDVYIAIWFVANLITILACVPAAILWRERMVIAKKGYDSPTLLRSTHLQYRKNYRWCRTFFWVNTAIGFWGGLMNIGAITWEGPVPIVVWGGTSGFTAIWLTVTAWSFWDFAAMTEIAEAREHERASGC